MKPALRIATIVLAGALASSMSAFVWYGFSEPPVNRLPLAEGLVDATTTEGQRLLASSTAKTDYEQLAPWFVSQERRAFCGVASSAIVINAITHEQPPLTQSTFFTNETSALRSSLAVTFGGLTLEQLAALLRTHGMEVEVVHARQSSLDAFRKRAAVALAEPLQFLIVNYDRPALKQMGGGHLSPLAAYDAESDRVLVLDVAAQKYPYTWEPAQDLWNAMNTTDSSSHETRGFLVIRDGKPSGKTTPATSNRR